MFAHPANPWLINTNLGLPNGDGAKMSPQNRSAPFVEPQHYIIDPANLCCTLYNGIEDRLHVGRRAADDTEHLGCCRLMLQRLVQFSVALLDLLEQPNILDGNDRLVRKGFQKFNLSIRERTYLSSPDDDYTNGGSLSEHGRAEKRTDSPGRTLGLRKFGFCGLLKIVNMHSLALKNRPT